eukprot:14154179-Ditylum_brightwellii.AAC.1
MNERFVTYHGLSDKQLQNVVKRARREASCGNIFSKLEEPRFRKVQGSRHSFLQHYHTYSDPDITSDKIERMLVYGNPTLFGTMKARLNILTGTQCIGSFARLDGK